MTIDLQMMTKMLVHLPDSIPYQLILFYRPLKWIRMFIMYLICVSKYTMPPRRKWLSLDVLKQEPWLPISIPRRMRQWDW